MPKKNHNYRILAFVFIFILSASIGMATNYHVSPSGIDSDNGSKEDPFMTIAKAASMVNPGDTVFVHEGTYIEDNIIPKSSGTENAMIVFKAVPGANGVIVKHPGTSIDDNTPVFQLANRNYIWIDGFQFKDFKYGRASIYISNGIGNVIINNRFENLGNSEIGSWDGNSVVALFNSSHNIVSNNYLKDIVGDGINVNSQRSEFNLINNNTFINFSGKLRSWGGQWLFSRAIDVQDMSNGNNVIAFNYAEDVVNHIWLDRDGSNNIILRNFGNGGAGNVFNESRCRANVIQENISVGMQSGYMSSYYSGTNWTYYPRYINNVAFNNRDGFVIHKSVEDEFRNNISFNNTRHNIQFSRAAMDHGPHIFQNNLWFSTSITNSVLYDHIPETTPTQEFTDKNGVLVTLPAYNTKSNGSQITPAAFQDAMGETNGLSTDPLFVSATDFTLQASSPAKGAGDNGLDLGAYAYYGPSLFGWEADRQTTGTLVYFDSVISTANRGETLEITIKLNKAHSQTITTEIVPVAGDGITDIDFNFQSATVTFAPGETSKTIGIEFIGEADFDEMVAFRLENITNAIPGARDLHLIRISKTPSLTAHAGFEQTVWEIDNSDSAEVVLDASLSFNPAGEIASFTWSLDGTYLASGENPTVTLPLGMHIITLTITDDEGNSAIDKVAITVIKASGVWLEAECGDVGSLWDIEEDENASNGQYVTIRPGNNSLNSAPGNESGLIRYSFDLEESGTYTLYLRVICPDPNADSFWLKMNDGAYASWNNIGPTSTWQWYPFPNTYNLNAGTNTLTIGYREDGSKLDKIWITNTDAAPECEGSLATNCETSAASNELSKSVNVYPNPVSDKLNIALHGSQVNISIYDTNGQLLFNRNENAASTTIDMAHFKQGVYILKIAGHNETIIKKLIKQ